MALANPPPSVSMPLPQTPPMPTPLSLLEQHRSLHNLLMMANSTGLLLAQQQHASFMAPSGQLLLPPSSAASSHEQIQEQQFSSAGQINNNAILEQQQQLLTPHSSQLSHQQHLPLDRGIWELLLAKSQALSLFSHALLPSLSSTAAVLPAGLCPASFYRLCQLRNVGVDLATAATLPLSMRQHAAENVQQQQPNDEGHHQMMAESQWKLGISQLDCAQLESLSRNKLGRSYNPGRPLGMLDRQKILELYQKGLKISHIAKVIGVTHSCVSKIMTRYRRTGSIHPRSTQMSVIGRKQSPTGSSESGCLAAPNCSPKLSPIQNPTTISNNWQWPPRNVEDREMVTTLQCSVPSAFQPICLLNGERASSEEEERQDGTASGSSGIGSLDGREMMAQAAMMAKEQKPYLVEKLLH